MNWFSKRLNLFPSLTRNGVSKCAKVLSVFEPQSMSWACEGTQRHEGLEVLVSLCFRGQVNQFRKDKNRIKPLKTLKTLKKQRPKIFSFSACLWWQTGVVRVFCGKNQKCPKLLATYLLMIKNGRRKMEKPKANEVASEREAITNFAPSACGLKRTWLTDFLLTD